MIAPYTATHPPSTWRTRHVIRSDRAGYVAVLAWPEKWIAGKPLTKECGHIHRTERAADECGAHAVEKAAR